MVREDGVVKVLDFGIARRAATGADPMAPTATATDGLIMGTAAYMAPEQVRGEDLDGRCDQFAWAVMAFELLTGEHPWGVGGDAVRLMSTMLTKPPRRLVDVRPDVPEVLSDVIARALSADREARFASMRALVDEIAPLVDAEARVATAATMVEVPERPPATAEAERTTAANALVEAARSSGGDRPRSRWIVGSVALAASAALAGLLYATVFARRSPPTTAGAAASTAPARASATASAAAAPGVAGAGLAKPTPRYRCHADMQARAVVPCGASSTQWCDGESRRIACCADGLVAAGHDGMCVCPPLTTDASRARGCQDAPDAKPFAANEMGPRLSAARERVRACFEDDAKAGRAARLGFLVDFSPEGEPANVRILRSDAPDPAKQACALRALRTMEGWASRGGAASWEMEWDVGAPPPALSAAKAETPDKDGYGYEFFVDSITTPRPAPPEPPPKSGGRLPPREILRVLRSAFPKFERCYRAAQEREPGLTGRVLSRLVIGPRGRVVEVELDGADLTNGALATCVTAGIADLEFPASTAGIVTVLYPLAFGAGADK
jgi:hypothetical protein